MTRSAIDLTCKIDGTRTSSTGVGIFVDGYYNPGWFGMPASSLIYGFCLRLFSVIGRVVIEEGALLMLPLAFASIFFGIRTNGSVLADVLATTVLFMPRLRHR